MRGVFVTGTDTGVGKTWAAAVLMHAFARAGLKTVGMKPVASGSLQTAGGLRNDDALCLQTAANVARPYALVNPYAFVPPIAPHLAAAEAGVNIELRVIMDAFRRLCDAADMAVVEGVGGWQVPLGEDWGVPELARALGLPVVLVVGLRLGCLNHARLSVRAIEADGLKLTGWIANGIDPGFERRAENVATLERLLPVPLLADFPWAPAADPAKLAQRLEAARLPRIWGAAAGT